MTPIKKVRGKFQIYVQTDPVFGCIECTREEASDLARDILEAVAMDLEAEHAHQGDG